MLIIFVLGMITLSIGLTLVKTGYGESLMGRRTASSLKAFYAANSGVEDAMSRIQNPSYVFLAKGDTVPYTFDLDDTTAKVKIYGTDREVTIESQGKYNNYLRKIKVVAQNTSSKPGFGNAIHADQGGVELEGTTVIKVLEGFPGDGNVYSNSYIKGTKNDYDTKKEKCSQSSSAVNGSAWAVEIIDKLESTDSGVCITKDAYSVSLNYCFVKGNVNSPSAPNPATCQYLGTYTVEDAPEKKDLPDMGIDILKNYLTARGKVFNGNCTLDGSGGPSDCSAGTYKLGEIKINGNLTINPKDPNKEIQVTGPIWVTGNLIIESNTSIGLDKSITEVSQLVVVDGTVLSNAGVKFGFNQDPFDINKAAFLLFISTVAKAPGPTDICDKDNYAVRLFSNTNSVLFYAVNGCVLVNANGTFQGAILGKKIRVITNSTVAYDPRLQNAIFGLTKSGGWQILSFKEE